MLGAKVTSTDSGSTSTLSSSLSRGPDGGLPSRSRGRLGALALPGPLDGAKPEAISTQLMSSASLKRLAAFTTRPDGGNPAGVWVGDTLPDPETMQHIAAEVGFSETAFVAPTVGFERVI